MSRSLTLPNLKPVPPFHADVRLTRTIGEQFVQEIEETLGLSVRVLVKGYWGFAATPYWNVDEAVRTGRTAAAQAKINALGPARSVELGKIPVVTGDWHTPIQIDPFRLSAEERKDMLWSRPGTYRWSSHHQEISGAVVVVSNDSLRLGLVANRATGTIR